MKSIKTIYKTGIGPSSSHSMGPKRAARHFLDSLTSPFDRIQVILYGSLAATGKGHLTDAAIQSEFSDQTLEIIWQPEEFLPVHSCAVRFQALTQAGDVTDERLYYSIGGGELADENGETISTGKTIAYSVDAVADILKICRERGYGFWEFALENESDDMPDFLTQVWQTMTETVTRGLSAGQTVLPGCLKLKRRASEMLGHANDRVGILRDLNLLSAYALAVSEENASGGQIVTAPTCGACGVLPAVLYYFYKNERIEEERIIRALATAGLFGASVAERASVSGAEIGCQGEVGTACAMAAAAAAQLLGGSLEQIEYAAEMALEHLLGLTCDPIAGMVQIPCIERNAFAAMRSLECASYALSTDGKHSVCFDAVVDVMQETGQDLQAKYKETAMGGLAKKMKEYHFG